MARTISPYAVSKALTSLQESESATKTKLGLSERETGIHKKNIMDALTESIHNAEMKAQNTLAEIGFAPQYERDTKGEDIATLSSAILSRMEKKEMLPTLGDKGNIKMSYLPSIIQGFKATDAYEDSLAASSRYWRDAVSKINRAKLEALNIKGPYSFGQLHTKDELKDYKFDAEAQYASIQKTAQQRLQQALTAEDDFSSHDKLEMRFGGFLKSFLLNYINPWDNVLGALLGDKKSKGTGFFSRNWKNRKK